MTCNCPSTHYHDFDCQLKQVNAELDSLAPALQRARELNALKQALEKELQGRFKVIEQLPYAGKSQIGKKPKAKDAENQLVKQFSKLSPEEQARLVKLLS